MSLCLTFWWSGASQAVEDLAAKEEGAKSRARRDWQLDIYSSDQSVNMYLVPTSGKKKKTSIQTHQQPKKLQLLKVMCGGFGGI